MLYITLVLIFIFVVILYKKIIRYNNFFREKSVPYVKPNLFFGNITEFVFGKNDFPNLLLDVHRKFPNERYYGFYQFLTPMLAISDPDLIKQITIKDFDSFTDHRHMVPEDTDKLWNSTLFASKGLKWKHLRVTLSPAFTSSKMKMIFYLMTECAQEFVDHFKKNGEKITHVELRNTLSRFATDVITSATLGLQVNSLKERNNIFFIMGRRISKIVDGSRGFILLLSTLSTNLMKIFNLPIVERDIGKFFTDLIFDIFKNRREKGVVRMDLIHLLMQAQKGNLKQETEQEEAGFATTKEYLNKDDYKNIILTDDDIVSQVIIFFMGGIDTTTVLLSCLGYELAINQDIQDKLFNEIEEKYEECKGNFQYRDILDMNYLDCVISETLRKYPPAFFLDRIANKNYTIEPLKSNESSVYLQKGDAIIIPVYGIQHDPRNYPNPEIFDPDRFSNDNKQNIKPYTYMPFGLGPRNCIGSRFALLSAKVILVHLLHSFRIIATEKTPKVFKLDPKSLNYKIIGGNWCGFEKRNFE